MIIEVFIIQHLFTYIIIVIFETLIYDAIAYYDNYFVVISDITSIVKESPTKFELYSLLYDYDDKWYQFGMALQVHHKILDELKLKYTGSKLDGVINSWKDTQPSPDTWETVITAIESPIINDKEKADRIRQYLSTGKLLLLSNEVINSGVQTTPVKCI